MSVGFFILGVFAEKGEPGYSLQVLALPSSGCGLSTSIPHANFLIDGLKSIPTK